MAEYIKREDALNAIRKSPISHMGTRLFCIDAIADIPADDVVERKHGKWEFNNPITADYMCSVCLERNDVCTPFCPNCGADMGWWSDDDV